MNAYRNSQLRLLPECGHAYAEQYVRGVEPLPVPSLHGGQNVHAAIRAAVHEIVSGSPFLNIHEITYRVVRGGDAEYFDALQVLTLFQESLAEDFTIDPKGVFLAEERLETELEVRGEPVTFFGTPDMVERTGAHRCRITDFKTHWHPLPREVFDADVQLPRYALLVAARYPAFTEFELVMRFVRYKNNYHTHVLTAADLGQVRENLVQQIATVRDAEARGQFEATPGSWCSLCGFHHTCPVIRRLREGGIDELSIDNDERARTIAGELIALDAWATATKDRLRRYLDEHPKGFVAVAGGSYGYGPVNEREIYGPELKRALTAEGVEPPDHLFKVDLKELDKFKRRLPEKIVAAIDEVTVERTTARMQFRRLPDPRIKKPAKSGATQEGLFA